MGALGGDGPPAVIPSTSGFHIDYADVSNGDIIGQGGNADVYRIRISRHNETIPLAVKQPRLQETLTSETVTRFVEEARMWESLDSHDHIVDIVDWDDEPLPWIAMEYMDGGTLNALIADEPLPFEQAIWVGLCVTRAVRHAHRHGVVHHDIKPANVLFRKSDNGWMVPKVSDWGLARMMLEETSSIEGLSPQYAAPEQFDTNTYGSPDDRTDVYQIGVLLYELTTGRPPFDGAAATVMQSILTEPPAPPSTVADLPQSIDDVIMPALEKEKADRYDSVVYLRDELTDLFESHRDAGSEQIEQPSDGAFGRRSERGQRSHGRPLSGANSSGTSETGASKSEVSATVSNASERREATEETANTTGTSDAPTSARVTTEETGSAYQTPPSDDNGSSRRSILKAGVGVTATGVVGARIWSAVNDTGTTDDGSAGNNDTPVENDAAATDVTAADADMEARIGVLLPESGDLGSIGTTIRDATLLAAEQINSSETPVTVDIQVEDTQTDQQAGVSGAETLVDAGYPAVVGPAASNITVPVAEEVFIPNRVVGMSPSSSAPELTDLDDDGYMFRTVPSEALQGTVMADVAVDQFGATSGTLFLNNEYEQAIEQEYVERFQEKGGQIGNRITFEPERSSYVSQWEQVLSDTPDAVMIAGIPQSGIQLFRDFYEEFAGTYDDVEFIVPNGLINDELPDAVGDDMSNLIGVVPSAEGPGMTFFENAYEDAYDDSPGLLNAHAYDAMVVLVLASAAAGESDGAAIRDSIPEVTNPEGSTFEPESVGDAIDAVIAGEPIEYQGASSRVEFDENGDMRTAVYDIMQVQNNSFEQIDQMEFSRSS